MSDPFSEAITSLMDQCPSITGAVFADLDGEDIAVHPREKRDKLRLCAAYGGIALRRLSGLEAGAGRGAVRRLVLEGSGGAFVSLKVGDEYQLVLSVERGTPSGLVLAHARSAVQALEENM